MEPKLVHILFPIALVLMATIIIIIRLRAVKKPVTAKKILIPPLGMSTGFIMFMIPQMQISWTWAAIAFISGVIFLAPPLVYTSNFVIREGKIFLQRSRAFIYVLVILLIVRLSLHSFVEQHISLMQTASLFFILAFGMLLPWRIVMFYRFRQILKLEMENDGNKQ